MRGCVVRWGTRKFDTNFESTANSSGRVNQSESPPSPATKKKIEWRGHYFILIITGGYLRVRFSVAQRDKNFFFFNPPRGTSYGFYLFICIYIYIYALFFFVMRTRIANKSICLWQVLSNRIRWIPARRPFKTRTSHWNHKRWKESFLIENFMRF